MKRSVFLRFFKTAILMFCSLSGAPAPASDQTKYPSLASEAAPLIRALRSGDEASRALLAELNELHATPGASPWPEGIRKSLGTADGADLVRKVLSRHGYLPHELRWLDELPRDAPPDLLTSVMVLQTRRLLREGPPAYEGLWPKWNLGDTPGSEPEEEREPGGLLPWIARHAGDNAETFLQSFTPRNVVYQELLTFHAQMLDELETRREAFIPIPPIRQGEVVKPGDAYAGAPILERRLIEEGYESPAAPDFPPEVKPRVFTVEMSDAVRRYQFHQGRTVDGILGPDTLRELNRSPDQELEILRINLHRARMLPDDMGRRYLLVNIPSTRVDAFSSSRVPVLSMKAIVGESVKIRQTPVFRDVMEWVEFSPYWNVPASIAKRDIIPKARRDRGDFEERGYEIVTSYTSSKTLPVNAGTLSQAESGKLLIRQRPGPKNALGQVKFLLPNDFHIYLHDTPEGRLFNEAERDFSNGCIRIEKPLELAEFVLGPQGWTNEPIGAALASGVNRRVKVANPVNVYIIYLTAFPTWDADRKVRFHPDLYQQDLQLLEKSKNPQKNGH